MKLILATVAVGFARLALASLVAAQVVDAGDTEPVRPRIEVGPTGGTTGAFPELGAVFSVPVDRRSAVEVVVGRMPATWEAPPHTLAQVQLRTPFRADLRSRKSLVVGVTRIVAVDDERGFLGGSDDGKFVRPHAGVSLQWPAGPAFDLRVDLRSRKSLVVGVTRIVADDDERGFLGGSDNGTFVRPHAGVSLQWPTGPAFDLRVDIHGIITFAGELPLVPRAMAGFVWHPRTGR